MDVYEGNSFNVKHVGDGWVIWRHRGEDSFEEVTLDTDGMDELRDYFAECWAEDKEGLS